MKVKFFDPSEVADERLEYAVIAARRDGSWIFCRHKNRDTWEIPGGHREEGEAIEETARRELWEESGAVDFELKPVAVYCVDKYGILYYADVKRLEDIPKSSEIAEIGFFEHIPWELTYPAIQPYLYRAVQAWLNTQTSVDELWDVYDKDRSLTGRLHRRGDFMERGDYHLVVHVWMKNSRGEYLLTKRAPNKGWSNMWESTGGSAIAGDDSLMAAIREVKEETGLQLSAGSGKCIISYMREDCFVDVWLFLQDFSLEDVVLQEDETVDKMYADADKIRSLVKNGEFVPYSYLERLFALED